MTRRGFAVVVAAAACVTAGVTHPPAAAGTQASPRPRLVVLLVVDQLRADYLERYSARWNGGLKRLMQEGAWYTNGAYPYASTVTCSGHATISTGRFPRSHGIVMNSWFERERGRVVECTADDRVQTVTSDGFIAGGDSAAKLQGSTFAGRVKASGGRVVTISLKGRSAIMPAGRQSDATVWFGAGGTFITSTAFSQELPPFARDTLAAFPLASERSSGPWTKLLPEDAYSGPDDGVGEKPPAGWTALFPHPIDVPQFFAAWQASPLSDAYLQRLAAAAIDGYKLGQGPATDFLSVSFSALDIVGHAFGPDSHEIQDMLARLDQTIGALLARLDERVGRGHYVLALTADHGVAPIPERMKGEGHDAGRIDTRGVARAVDAALQPLLGPGQYVAAVLYTDLYFAPGAWDRIVERPGALEAVKQAILASGGVQRVFEASELHRVRADDPFQRAAALGYFKGRSGDLILVPKRLWIASAAATTHGTPHDYDQRVPIIFFGGSVRAARLAEPATPADIAPTLGRLAQIRFDTPDGRVLPVQP